MEEKGDIEMDDDGISINLMNHVRELQILSSGGRLGVLQVMGLPKRVGYSGG